MAVTFHHVLTSELKEFVAASTQEGAVVAGKSNTTMLAFQERLSLGCSALRYVSGSCLCSLRKQAERHSVVMNSTYVWEVGAEADKYSILPMQYVALHILN